MDDDELLTELGDAVRAANAVPASFLAAGKAAFAWRTVDGELAELAHDTTALAGTRTDRARLRALTFVASELTIEVEVSADGLVGQVVPAQAGRIRCEGPAGRVVTVDVDDVGWFAIRPVPRGPMRLSLRTAAGAVVRTEWMTL